MNTLPLIWKTHKQRGDFNECPHCGKRLKWIFDGIEWLPCDSEPVLFVMHPQGKNTLVYHRELIDRCLLFDKRDKRTHGANLTGHRQHYYTCPWLISRRREYGERMREYERNRNM